VAGALSSVMLSPTTLPVQLVGEIFPIFPLSRRSAAIAAGSGPDGSGMWYDCPEIPMRCCDSPVARFCTGHCNRNEPPLFDKVHVVSTVLELISFHIYTRLMSRFRFVSHLLRTVNGHGKIHKDLL